MTMVSEGRCGERWKAVVKNPEHLTLTVFSSNITN